MTDALEPVSRAIGWALLHSVWQGTLIAVAVWGVLRLCRGASPSARYLVACAGLAALLAAWTATAVYVGRHPTTRATAPLPPLPVGASTAVLPDAPVVPSPAIRPFPDTDLPVEGVGPPVASLGDRLDAWSLALVPAWLAGVLLCSIRLVYGWHVVGRLRRRVHGPAPEWVRRRTAALATRLGIRKTVRVVESTLLQVPAVIGWLRPVLLLPASAVSGLTPAQLEAVIVHELAHIRRHDYAVNVLQSAAEALLFYHPACWWLSRRIRVEREHCCDDIAVEVSGDPVVYAAALAELESLRADGPVLAVAATGGSLVRRISRLLNPAPSSAALPAWSAFVLPAAVVALVGIGVRAAVVSPLADSPRQTSPSAREASLDTDEGMIRGRVLDESGHPIPGAVVTADSAVPSSVDGPFVVVGRPLSEYVVDQRVSVETGKAGVFVVRGIPPGSYRLSARASGYVAAGFGATSMFPFDPGAPVDVQGGRVTTGIDLRLQAAGGVSGRVFDERGGGLPGVEVELLVRRMFDSESAVPIAFAQTDADGFYRIRDVAAGEYLVRAYPSARVGSERDSAARAPARRDTQRVYAAAFYPGGRTEAEALPVSVLPGQEMFGVDFPLPVTTTARVSGTASDPDREPGGGLQVVLRPLSVGSVDDTLSAAVDTAGRFEIRDVPPGDYVVLVRDPRSTSRWVPAIRRIVVDGSLELKLRASPGAHIDGRVVTDGSTSAAPSMSGMMVGYEVRHGEASAWNGGSTHTDDDGRFSFESPGDPIVFTVSGVPRGWMVKTIRLDGVDVADRPVDTGGGRRTLEVVLTDRVSSLAGLVVDRGNRVLPNHSVVIFPRDAARWHAGSRLIRSARSSSSGQFLIDAVPPGEYLAIAVGALPPHTWADLEVLARLRAEAEPIEIREGERKSISIRASSSAYWIGAGAGPPPRVLRLRVNLSAAPDRARAAPVRPDANRAQLVLRRLPWSAVAGPPTAGDARPGGGGTSGRD